MNNQNKLTAKEKNIIFENIWDEYSQSNKNKNVYMYLSIAAMIFLSVIIFSKYYNTDTVNFSNPVISSIVENDLYEDDEIIFDDSINEMSDKELDSIVAQL